MTEAGGIRLFLDRSTNGKRFAEAVKRLFPETVTIGERYGVAAAEGVPDVDWIRDATAEGRIGFDVMPPGKNCSRWCAGFPLRPSATDQIPLRSRASRYEGHLTMILICT